MEPNEIRTILDYTKEQGKDNPIQVKNELTQRLILAATNLTKTMHVSVRTDNTIKIEDIKAEYQYLIDTLNLMK